MNIADYTAVVDTLILVLLVCWAIMDRCSIYIKKDKDS
jgi:hypothetical protein